jgi:AcrR family transcriptional regulator
MARAKDASMADRIIEAAIAVFGERGLQATTIKEIADRAGVASGSVYTCFKDKEDLFRASVQQGWAFFLSEMANLAYSTKPLPARFEEFLENGFTTLQNALPLLRGMMSDSNRMNLLSEPLDKLCVYIGLIFASEETDSIVPGLRDQASKMIFLKSFVTGTIFMAAMAEPERTGERIAAIRDMVRELVSAKLVGWGSAGAEGSARKAVDA